MVVVSKCHNYNFLGNISTTALLLMNYDIAFFLRTLASWVHKSKLFWGRRVVQWTALQVEPLLQLLQMLEVVPLMRQNISRKEKTTSRWISLSVLEWPILGLNKGHSSSNEVCKSSQVILAKFFHIMYFLFLWSLDGDPNLVFLYLLTSKYKGSP